MAASVTREFLIVIENAPGALGALGAALGKAGVNITGFSVHPEGPTGMLRLVTSDPERTRHFLGTTDYLWRAREAVLVSVTNAPGELARVALALGRAGVNIEATYVNIPAAAKPVPQLVLAVSDVKKAIEVL